MTETYKERVARENREALAFWGTERRASVTQTATDGTVFSRTFRATRVDRKWLDKHGGWGCSWAGVSYGYAIEVVGHPSEGVGPASNPAWARDAAVRHVRQLVRTYEDGLAAAADRAAAVKAVEALGGPEAARLTMLEVRDDAKALQAQADRRWAEANEIERHLRALGVDVT